MQRSRKIAFSWYGGKFSQLSWLLPLLPECHHYCEPFGGSAAVLLNRKPSPVETYNDLDGEVVNFFRVLRDDPDALIRACALTPFSKDEFRLAIQGDHTGIPDVERAQRFFVRSRQARSGLAQVATVGRWAACKRTSCAGMSGSVSRWLNGIDGLAEVAERLVRVQIENRPALEVIRACDSPSTLFYCDPPYVHATRVEKKAYAFEMTDEEHRALAQALSGIQGKAAVSGYRSEVMDELFRDWHRFDAPAKRAPSGKSERQESLWTNYDPFD